MTLPSDMDSREFSKFREREDGQCAVAVDLGNADVSTGGGGGGDATYRSPEDFTVAYTSAETITLSGLPYTPTTVQFVSVKVQVSADKAVTYSPTGSAFSYAAGVLTVAGATFAATDEYVVTVIGPDKAYTAVTTSNRNTETDPLSAQHTPVCLVDTTNISAATHYYPSATGGTMDGYKDISATGKFIDADGTLTLTLEVSNDEDAATADFNAIKFHDDDSLVDAEVASLTVTNGTLLITASKANLNYRRYRWVVVASGATNTVILYERKKAL